ncbi:hypothetical protein JTB14_035274 [Gonioctena quinquepunctata]|nr:hypothetical protein JTB14_035274 [Gonioctena quinquepunctata]
MVSGQLQDAITSAFNGNCPPVSRNPESWRRYCEEGTHEAARLHKIVAKEPQQMTQAIRTESGVFTQNGKPPWKNCTGYTSQER